MIATKREVAFLDTKKKILIIDDDEKLISLLTEYLTRFDYAVASATRPERGLELVSEARPDLVILDVMLPGKDGFEVCREIRKAGTVPILMLTARGDVTDRIVGLELGADDYLGKPFEPRELAARIQSILRRTKGAPASAKDLRFGELELDPARREAKLSGRVLELTTMEYEVLNLFASHPGQVFSREQLMDELRGLEWEAYNRSIDVLISRLRQKLGDDPKSPKYLKTIWGTGYLFIAAKG